MKLLITFTVLFFFSITLSGQEDKKGFIKEVYVGSNLASLIRGSRDFFPERNFVLTTNQYANLEMVFNFHPKFSIRVAAAHGLNGLVDHVENGGSFAHHWFDTGPDPQAPVNLYQNGPRLDAPSVSTQIITKFKYSNPNFTFARPQDLVYQIGVFPQLFFYQDEKYKWSITAGANFGKMDKYAISEYNSFGSIKNSTNDTIIGWIQRDSRLEFESNSFNFIRGEILFGVDIKLNKRLVLNLETGFTHFINGKGEKPDKIYTNLDYKGDKLIFTDTKNNDFITKWDEQGSASGRILQIYMINRFSLRYRIK